MTFIYEPDSCHLKMYQQIKNEFSTPRLSTKVIVLHTYTLYTHRHEDIPKGPTETITMPIRGW